jgi:leucyl aminopeptidase
VPLPRIEVRSSLPTANTYAVAVAAGSPIEAAAVADVQKRCGVDIKAAAKRGEFKADAGEVLAVPTVSGRAKLAIAVGLGDRSGRALRRAGAALARKSKDGEHLAVRLPGSATVDEAAAFAEGLLLGSYAPPKRTDKPREGGLQQISLVASADGAADGVARAQIVADAVARARDLAHTPSDIKSPDWLAQQAAELAEQSGLRVRVRGENELADEGFNGILAVGQGSSRPPRLVELEWAPKGAERHVVLIGKGITFDSGGLSLKPLDGMVAMKTDMAAAGAVIAAMGALKALDVRTRVTAVVPIAENLPSGTAQRPSDVIRHYGGTTVEVLNTDAEGRLVLADALAYADRELKPDVVVDLATLTGAVTLGLGRRHGGLYSNDDALAAQLVAAADDAGERLWRLPLVDDYRDSLDSTVADLRNMANPEFAYSGGSIVAALFLREFAGNRPWAHLDIAGAGRSDGEEDEVGKGPTGFGVRTLLRWLTSG